MEFAVRHLEAPMVTRPIVQKTVETQTAEIEERNE
jgi:hypothetical protein